MIAETGLTMAKDETMSARKTLWLTGRGMQK
jgi:hypothetical protein